MVALVTDIGSSEKIPVRAVRDASLARVSLFASLSPLALSLPGRFFSPPLLGRSARLVGKLNDNGRGSKLRRGVCSYVREENVLCMRIYAYVILCMLSVSLLEKRSSKAQSIFIFYRGGIEQKTAFFWLVDLSVISSPLALSLSPLSLSFSLPRSLSLTVALSGCGKTVDILAPRRKSSSFYGIATFLRASSRSIFTRLLQINRQRRS